MGTGSRHELCGHTRIDWADAGTDRGRIDCGIPALAADLFCEYSDWAYRPDSGVFPFAELSRGAHRSARPGGIALVRIGRGAAVLCAGSVWRAHVEHPRDSGFAGAFGG